MRRALAAAVLAAVSIAGCGGGDDGDLPVVEGIVLAVDGDLESVAGFTIVDESGATFTFVPAEGLTFHDGPLSHLSAHITSGEPVVVEYETGDDGILIAVSVADADG